MQRNGSAHTQVMALHEWYMPFACDVRSHVLSPGLLWQQARPSGAASAWQLVANGGVCRLPVDSLNHCGSPCRCRTQPGGAAERSRRRRCCSGAAAQSSRRALGQVRLTPRQHACLAYIIAAAWAVAMQSNFGLGCLRSFFSLVLAVTPARFQRIVIFLMEAYC